MSHIPDFDILDCTLRDGGYYTDWDFEPSLVAKYAAAMHDVRVDCVELGYRSPRKPGYHGRYFYIDRGDVVSIREALHASQRISLMLNAKDVSEEAIRPLLEDLTGVVDLVRFACPPDQLSACVGLAEQVSALGFECMINVMYLNEWLENPSVVDPLRYAADVVQRVALVDSYGACFPQEVAEVTRAVVDRLPQTIGFHGHDNIQLAFANTLAALQGGCEMVDATVLGMGRGAGNLRTELIVAYRDHYLGGSKLGFDKLADLLDAMQQLRQEHEWGPNLAYAVAGFAGLKQAQVMEWLGKRRYTAASIISALRQPESLELDSSDFPDVSDLASAVGGDSTDPVIVIGGGASAYTHVAALRRFLNRRNNALVVHSSLRHATLLPEVPAQLFCFPGHEAVRARAEGLRELPNDTIAACVVPEPPRFARSVPAGHRILQVANRAQSLEQQLGPVSDASPLQIALSVVLALGRSQVYLYGFDGGLDAVAATTQDIQQTIDFFGASYPDLKVSSVTPTSYLIPCESIYGFEWDSL